MDFGLRTIRSGSFSRTAFGESPLFDATCDTEPLDLVDGECTGGPGNGQNQWYHIARFVVFLMDSPQGAFVSGSNKEAITHQPGPAHFSILVQNPEDLLLACHTLNAKGSPGWATLMTPKGPLWVPISEISRHVSAG